MNDDARPAQYEAAARRRDEGLERVERGADADWLDLAYDLLVGYLTTHREFFVDSFWNDTGLPKPREARALGSVVQRAARAGFITKTGEYRPSVRSNLQVKPVWHSEIFDPEAVAVLGEAR